MHSNHKIIQPEISLSPKHVHFLYRAKHVIAALLVPINQSNGRSAIFQEISFEIDSQLSLILTVILTYLPSKMKRLPAQILQSENYENDATSMWWMELTL